MQKIWGKFIGGTLGLAAGGPVGAILGLLIGHVHDLNMGNNSDDSLIDIYGHLFSGNSQQSTFTTGVIVLGAKMAKADGRVTRAEIEAFKRVFQIAPGQEVVVGKMFDAARENPTGFEPYAFQLAQAFNRSILEEILGGLFIIAAADNAGLSAAEMKYLQKVASIFSFSESDFVRIAARAGVRVVHTGEKASTAGVSRHPHEEYYAILGITETSTNEEIKIAYRTLIREHHPDKLMAEGMAPEFVESANEKMKRINVAYDTVSKARGIK